MWPDVHVEYLQVHEVADSHAEVTEGNPWPIGYVWERLHYDWSDSHALQGKVVGSNLFKPGSTWELWATPEDGGSRVEIRAVRHLRGRGWLLAPFFLPIPLISAAATVRAHLRHFLDSIERPITSARSTILFGKHPCLTRSRQSGLVGRRGVEGVGTVQPHR